MGIKITPLIAKNTPATGLEVAWSDSQFVMIICDKGVVACGVVDKEVMNRAGAAIAIARGTREKPLKTVEDLLKASIVDLTDKAAEYGVSSGMTGQEALDAISSA
ncbi:MAG TPA: DUF1805 domain-containing protein [Candidatus Hydrogenedentes bacterium]|nr:DUF1805 domain-containing protein [Candidatus Hydrogenedentota bacterium]